MIQNLFDARHNAQYTHMPHRLTCDNDLSQSQHRFVLTQELILMTPREGWGANN